MSRISHDLWTGVSGTLFGGAWARIPALREVAFRRLRLVLGQLCREAEWT